MNPIESIQQLLHTSHKVVIVIHQSPDGDALGSGMALARYLTQKGHRVSLLSPDSPPSFLGWLPGMEGVLSFDKDKERRKAVKALEEADMIFCLDFPVLHRAGDIAPLIGALKVPKVVLDHHPDHEVFADVMWIDTQAAATSVLVYRMMAALDEASLGDTDIATCLYVGIFTDTGSFQYTNTNEEAHRLASQLIERGADLPLVRRHINPRISLHKAKFNAHMFLNRLVVMPKYRAAYFLLPRTDYLTFDLQSGDTSGLASQALEVEGVDLGVLLVEKEHKIHLSFRSVSPIAVNHLSQKYFGGGGHRYAAGGSCMASLQATEQKLRQAIAAEVPCYLASSSSNPS